MHPRLTELFGQPCFPSLSALPRRPDCVALAVANHHLLALLQEAADTGVPSAVVFGDPMVGAGRAPELEDKIAELASRCDIAVCGPNAMGVYALHHRLVISGYPDRVRQPVPQQRPSADRVTRLRAQISQAHSALDECW